MSISTRFEQIETIKNNHADKEGPAERMDLLERAILDIYDKLDALTEIEAFDGKDPDALRDHFRAMQDKKIRKEIAADWTRRVGGDERIANEKRKYHEAKLKPQISTDRSPRYKRVTDRFGGRVIATDKNGRPILLDQLGNQIKEKKP